MAENHNAILKQTKSVISTKIAPVELEDNKQDTSVSQCHDDTAVYKALSSLRLSLLFGGLIFKKKYSKTGIKRYLTASRLYTFIILIFLVFNAFRWLTMFQGNDKFGSNLFMKIALCVFCMQSVSHLVSFAIASETGRLSDFFLEWEHVRANCSRTLAYITLLSNRCTAILWTLVFCHVGVCTYLIYFTDLQNMQLAPWDEDFEYASVVRIITLIFQVYLATSWTGASALMFVICMTLAREFNKISLIIKKSSPEPMRSAINFGTIRQNHQKLCNLVMKADNLLSMQIACSLSGCMLVSCLLLYYTIYEDSVYGDDYIVLATKIFWIVANIGRVIFDCVSGAVLNGAVRGQQSVFHLETFTRLIVLVS